MSVDCWSVSAGPLNMGELAHDSANMVTVARLDMLPHAVVLTGKMTVRSLENAISINERIRIIAKSPTNSDQPRDEWSLVTASLYFNSSLVDSSNCNLFTFTSGATTVCVHGTIDIPLPTTTQSGAHANSGINNVAFLRIMDNGFKIEIANIWLTAVALSSLRHHGADRPKVP